MNFSFQCDWPDEAAMDQQATITLIETRAMDVCDRGHRWAVRVSKALVTTVAFADLWCDGAAAPDQGKDRRGEGQILWSSSGDGPFVGFRTDYPQ